MPQPPLVFPNPPLPALPTPDGLFAAVEQYGGLVNAWPAHIQNAGAIWVPDTSVGAELYPAPCQSPPYPAFTIDAIDGMAQAWPFIAYATLDVAAAGFDRAEVERRVRQRLTNYEQNEAEQALFGGTATLFTGITNFAGTVAPAAGIAGVAGGIFQQLANAGASAGYRGELTGGAGTGVVEAVSLLEQSLATNYYGQGYIHARPRMAAYLAYRNQFKFVPVPPVEQTWNENVLVLGNGYLGTGPAGEVPDATTEYIWATGRICIWRGDIWVDMDSDHLVDRSTNQRKVYAFRPYAIGVESFSASCKVIRINAVSATA